MTSVYVLTPVSLLDAQGIGPAAKLVYQRLMAHLNRKTGQCNPRLATLAKELDVSESTVKRAVKTLREAGAIRTQKGRLSYVFELLGIGSSQTKMTSHARSKCSRMPDQNDLADDRPSLLTEQYELNNKNGTAADVGCKAPEYSAPVEASAAAAAAPVLNLQENPNAKPTRAVNLTGLARAIGERLLAVHPSPGLPYRAFPLIEKILTGAHDPEAMGQRIENSHREWRTFWDNVPPGKMIPQLWNWLASGEWEFMPVQRKGVLSEKSRTEFAEAEARFFAERETTAAKVKAEIEGIIARGRAACA